MIPLKKESGKIMIQERTVRTDDYDLSRLSELLSVNLSSPELFASSLPFSMNDSTAGSENELQTVVIGKKQDVDFPITIEESTFYKNMLKRAQAGETSHRSITDLQDYLNVNPDNVWENSWVKFPRSALNEYSNQVFKNDLLEDKKKPDGPKRKDCDKFIIHQSGEELLRIPVSYLLKLSLADIIAEKTDIHPLIRTIGETLLNHFLNDNTSPETFSFYPVSLSASTSLSHYKMGQKVAKESLKRFLLTQLLVFYANKKFQLIKRGQRVIVYFAPHPHTRQKILNELISDSFYRDIFMSPCLSGWNKGLDKHEYMKLCHRVLSRSQLNTISKLKEAGIITRNLVVLPNLSNISLANNGTHVSLGSKKLTKLLKNPESGYTKKDEKYIGDLAVKIIEHFLPLFIDTYSAAPYRLDFWDFHPEKALGFLPHELDFTHLRMIWRRWKKKANLKILGNPITPFGPECIDRWISKIFRLKGDFINDFRLIDYFTSVLSTNESPALNGVCGNDIRLKEDLACLGVFSKSMPLYLLYRIRECADIGFSGFEGRYYSLFENLMDDMGEAVSLQNLITALAFKYIIKGDFTHAHIPDDPEIESERRQIFFGLAIGIPTFFVNKKTKNQFMVKIFKKIKKIRPSRRYSGYLRAYNIEYRKALIEILEQDGADLIEIMGLEQTIKNLKNRIIYPEYSAQGRLMQGILDYANVSNPMKLCGQDFNMAAEKYYRNILRTENIKQAFLLLQSDLERISQYAILGRGMHKNVLNSILGEKDVTAFLNEIKSDLINEKSSLEHLTKLIYLIILNINSDIQENRAEEKYQNEITSTSSIY